MDLYTRRFPESFRYIRFWPVLLVVFLGLGFSVAAQDKPPAAPPVEALPKPVAEGTTPEGKLFKDFLKTQRTRFSYGRSIKVTLPPVGNLVVTGTSKLEVSVEARVHVEGASSSELDELARRIGFTFGLGETSFELISVGPQIKLSGKEKKKVLDGLSSPLQKLPYRIDYVLKVPEYTDLDVSVFDGDLTMGTIYGGIVFRAQKSNVKLTGMAGTVVGTVGTGSVLVELTSLSWRGSGIKVEMGLGDIALSVPRGYSADVTLAASEPLDIQFPLNRGEDVPDDAPIGNQLRARFGVGGAEMIFGTQRGKLKVVQYPPLERK
jgi:hypothetical protein